MSKQVIPVAGFNDVVVEHGDYIYVEGLDDSALTTDEARQIADALDPKRAARSRKIEAAPSDPEPVASSEVEKLLGSYLNLKTPVLLDYRKADGSRITRTVSPAKFEPGAVPGTKLLVGFDHARGRVGNFRIDRVLGIAPAPVEFVEAD